MFLLKDTHTDELSIKKGHNFCPSKIQISLIWFHSACLSTSTATSESVFTSLVTMEHIAHDFSFHYNIAAKILRGHKYFAYCIFEKFVYARVVR